MASKRKLYRLSSEDFKVYSHVEDRGRAVMRHAGQLPMVSWPNGRWCTEANAFVYEQVVRGGCSTLTRGGTALTYVAHLSHLLRFCAFRRRHLIDMSDADFGQFIESLRRPMNIKGRMVRPRSDRTVRDIGHTCLRFLQFVGTMYGFLDFVSPNGRIQVTVRRYQSGGRRRTKYMRKEVISHRSFPTGEVKRRRLPINARDIERLREAAASGKHSVYVVKRRLLLLTLLEVTGGRRVEVANLTVESVLAATKMREPKLRLFTAKRGSVSTFRMVPISRTDLDDVAEFIEVNRQAVVRRTCGSRKDDGFVFLSERTGRRISVESVTTELSLLRRKAGISGRACAHMFRHRFITKYFLMLLERHRSENVDDFRRLLIDADGLKAEVQEVTGHLDVASLDIYIHLAFEEFTGKRAIAKKVTRDIQLESAQSRFDRLKKELATRTPTASDYRRLERFVDAMLLDQLDPESDTEHDE